MILHESWHICECLFIHWAILEMLLVWPPNWLCLEDRYLSCHSCRISHKTWRHRCVPRLELRLYPNSRAWSSKHSPGYPWSLVETGWPFSNELCRWHTWQAPTVSQLSQQKLPRQQESHRCGGMYAEGSCRDDCRAGVEVVAEIANQPSLQLVEWGIIFAGKKPSLSFLDIPILHQPENTGGLLVG